MARLAYPDHHHDDGELGDLLDRIRRERGGQLLNLYRMLLHSPPVAAGWLALGTAVRHEAELAGRSRELAICLVARLTGADYEWQQHEPLARGEGVTPAQLAVLPDWRSGDFDARDRALLAYAQALTEDVTVDDDTFASAAAHFAPRELVELTVTVGFYGMVARFLLALGVDPEPG